MTGCEPRFAPSEAELSQWIADLCRYRHTNPQRRRRLRAAITELRALRAANSHSETS